MFISEVLEDLLDPDKAGDGVRGLEEALGKGSLNTTANLYRRGSI